MGIVSACFKFLIYTLLLISSVITFYFFFVQAKPIDDSFWSNEQFVTPNASWKFLVTNGVSLNVMESGPNDGPLMILLHGFPSTGLLTWRKEVDGLASAGFHVIVPDMRGYNTSDKPEGISSYSLDLLTDDVVGIADHFKQSKFTLVGHDWGAIVAWHTAHKYPDRLFELVIVNVPHMNAMSEIIKTQPQQILLSWYMLWFQLPILPELKIAQNNWTNAYPIFESGIPQVTFSKEEAQLHIEALKIPNAITSTINYYRALFRGSNVASSFSENPYLKVKTLVLWGEKDSVLVPELAHISFNYCPDGSKLVMIPQGTHWVTLEEPKKIVNEIVSFCN